MLVDCIKDCSKELNDCINEPRPLDFGENTYSQLIHIINFHGSSTIATPPGVPGKNLMSTWDFTTCLFELPTPKDNQDLQRWVVTPFIPSSSAYPVFVVAVEHLSSLIKNVLPLRRKPLQLKPYHKSLTFWESIAFLDLLPSPATVLQSNAQSGIPGFCLVNLPPMAQTCTSCTVQ